MIVAHLTTIYLGLIDLGSQAVRLKSCLIVGGRIDELVQAPSLFLQSSGLVFTGKK